ncbi:MAG: bifunctional glutamate N-acetyltransferase/amino-acid acetyltransferase ArgJ [Pseudomonadota bacterium]
MARGDKKKKRAKPEAGTKSKKKSSKRAAVTRVVLVEAAKKKGAAVSPLAPLTFPELPPVSGVRFATAAAGIKSLGRDDVMLAACDPGTVVAGVFTRSSTRSAPVRDCETKLAALDGPGAGLAFVVNSGNANAFTGKAGDGTVKKVCKAAAKALKIKAGRVFTASTGVIGEPLPPEKITEVIAAMSAGLDENGAKAAARAIMTTDTFAKGAAVQGKIGGKPVRLVGIAKGSGMIAPDMATMLSFLFTDAALTPPVAQQLLGAAMARSFNAITVDGDTSTSDTVMLAATARAGNAPIADARSKAGRAFSVMLEAVAQDLALQIVRDGEGATKLVEIRVINARNDTDADKVARSIANSPLVKTAIAGEDPNWGRVVMAVGKSGAEADRDTLSIRFGDILVAENGWRAKSYDEADGAAYMRGDELVLTVDLGLGKGAATVWTCDMTHGYISINADYRS